MTATQINKVTALHTLWTCCFRPLRYKKPVFSEINAYSVFMHLPALIVVSTFQ